MFWMKERNGPDPWPKGSSGGKFLLVIYLSVGQVTGMIGEEWLEDIEDYNHEYKVISYIFGM